MKCSANRPRILGRATIWAFWCLAILLSPFLRATSSVESDAPLRWERLLRYPAIVLPMTGYSPDEPGLLERMASTLPTDLHGHVAVKIHVGQFWQNHDNAEIRRAILALADECERLRLPFFYCTGMEVDKGGFDERALVAEMYPRYPHMVGTALGENWFDSFIGAIDWLLPIAAQHGGAHLLGSHQFFDRVNDNLRRPARVELLRRHGRHLLLVPKAAGSNHHYVDGGSLGWWLAGLVGEWGPYFDHWNWMGWNMGLPGRRATGLGATSTACAPETIWVQQMLHCASAGARVFYFENQVFGDRAWTPLAHHVLAPTVRMLSVIPAPDRAAVLARTRLAFSNRAGELYAPPPGPPPADGDYYRRVDFFVGLYEEAEEPLFSPRARPHLMSSGRYGILPVFPAATAPSLLAAIPGLADASDLPRLATPEARRAWANAHCPSEAKGDALALRFGQGWLIYNSRVNQPGVQRATLPLGAGRLELEVTEHAFVLMLPLGGDRWRVHANNYRVDKTSLAARATTEGTGYEVARRYMATEYIDHPADKSLRLTRLCWKSASDRVPILESLNAARPGGDYDVKRAGDERSIDLLWRHNGAVDAVLGLR